ncbi:MAG: hypothetical protein IJN29_08560 [Akkermansia sp.]|nr:hypothetical protein [Akkermansia sp.]
MKKIISTLVACAAATSLSSCGGIGFGDYIGCVFNPGDCTTEECVIGKTIDGAVNELLGTLNGVDTPEEAEDLADTMDTLLTAIEAAQSLNIKVPSSAKNAYNKALARLEKHNYFNSEQVRTALSTARYL